MLLKTLTNCYEHYFTLHGKVNAVTGGSTASGTLLIVCTGVVFTCD